MVSSCFASKKSPHLPYGLRSLMDLMRWLFRKICMLQVLMMAEGRRGELRLHPLINQRTMQKHVGTQRNWTRRTGRGLTVRLVVLFIQRYLQKHNSCRHPVLLLAKSVPQNGSMSFCSSSPSLRGSLWSFVVHALRMDSVFLHMNKNGIHHHLFWTNANMSKQYCQ